MSITSRFLNLARSNLNALLDKAAEAAGGLGSGGPRSRDGIDDLSDEELEAELARRRRAREQEQVEREARQREAEQRAREARQTAGGGPRAAGAGGAKGSARENKIAQYYAQLEVPYGSNLETVKQAYRRLMRKYHPDLHSSDPARQKIATELSQSLTRAYQELQTALGKKM